MLLKKMKLVVAGLTLAALAACSAAGAGDPDKEKPVTEVKAPLTLNSLKVKFKDESSPLLLFEKERTSYVVQTSIEKTGLVLEYEAPENVNVEVSPQEIPNYLGGTEAAELDDPVPVDLENLPIPREDPDFVMDAAAGVDAYSIILTLSLKPGSPESTREGNTIYNWQPNTYIITMQEQLANIDSEENKAKVNEKIAEAQQKIDSLGLVVGNPAENDESVEYIRTLVSELNTLKRGEPKEITIDTRTEPDEGVSYTMTEDPDTGDITYHITTTEQVYDYLAILTKAKQLNVALENSSVENIIVDKLEIAYKAPSGPSDPNVQDVKIGSNGKYKIEMAGGSGGHVWTGSNDTTTGGRAAKITATFNFSQGQKLGFRIGGEGIGTADLAIINNPLNTTTELKFAALKEKWGGTSQSWTAEKPGGFNGGGKGGQVVEGYRSYYSYAPGSGGGGATDVRVYNGAGPNFIGTIDFNPASDARIMVAAGGGGSAQSAAGSGITLYRAFSGGHAGENGSTVYSGSHLGVQQAAQISDLGNTYTPYQHDPLPPKDPNYVKTPASASGDNGVNGANRYEGRGGGGGGFKGGEAITNNTGQYKGGGNPGTGDCTGSGAGGSSHVKSTALSKTMALRSDQYGNGYAVIEWIP